LKHGVASDYGLPSGTVVASKLDVENNSPTYTHALVQASPSCRGVSGRPRETMSGLVATSSWCCRGGGCAVNVVATMGEADRGPVGDAAWRGDLDGRGAAQLQRHEAESGFFL